jgi:ribonuclease P protein component
MSERFSTRERIRRRADYLRIQREGSRTHGRYVTLVGLPNGSDTPRLGVTASRRLGAAAARNRAKRLIREIFRRNKPTQGLDLVVIPRRELLEATFAAVQEDFRSTLRRYVRTARR